MAVALFHQNFWAGAGEPPPPLLWVGGLLLLGVGRILTPFMLLEGVREILWYSMK